MKIFSKSLMALLIVSLFATVLVGCSNSQVNSSAFDIEKVEGK